MNFEPNNCYHIFNQGNNGQQVFRDHFDYKKFLSLFKSYCIPYCDVIAWCLIPNHFHLMVVANEKCSELKKQGGLMLDPLTNGIRKLLSAYAHDFNKRDQRSGSLFRQKTKAKNLSQFKGPPQYTLSDYLINCFYYVHQNPLLHKIVCDLSRWPYSSFLYYAGLRDKDFCKKEIATQFCDYHPATFKETVMGGIEDYYIELFGNWR